MDMSHAIGQLLARRRVRPVTGPSMKTHDLWRGVLSIDRPVQLSLNYYSIRFTPQKSINLDRPWIRFTCPCQIEWNDRVCLGTYVSDMVSTGDSGSLVDASDKKYEIYCMIYKVKALGPAWMSKLELKSKTCLLSWFVSGSGLQKTLIGVSWTILWGWVSISEVRFAFEEPASKDATHAIIIDAMRSLNLAGARESYSGSVEIYWLL